MGFINKSITADQSGKIRQFFRRMRASLFNGVNNGAGVTSSFIWHLHPRTLPESALKFNRTFGLGGMALLLFALQAVSGILLRFYYQPNPAEAYFSVLALQNDVLFGQFIRNIHYWSGSYLVIVVFLHLLRVYFSGAFYSPRQLNWLLGLALLFLSVFSGFTGYLLPWDQRAYWATTISSGMLEYIPLIGAGIKQWIVGGETIGKQTLLNFYTLHTAVFPILIVFVMSFHFWRVRKAGGVAVPAGQSQQENKYIPAVPDLVFRELVAALTLLAFILIIAALFNAPLQELANPGLSPNPTKAAWYFMGLQELLLHFHPVLAAFVIPLLLTAGLIALPYLNYSRAPVGVWFVSDKGKRMAVASLTAALMATPLFILADHWLPDMQTLLPAAPVLAAAILQGLFLLTALLLFYIWIKKRYSANTNESLQALFVFIAAGFLILTVTGIWFRGPGMQLIWPWQMP